MGEQWKSKYDVIMMLLLIFANSQPRRYLMDEWDHAMMARDKRLTGHTRKQQVLHFIECNCILPLSLGTLINVFKPIGHCSTKKLLYCFHYIHTLEILTTPTNSLVSFNVRVWTPQNDGLAFVCLNLIQCLRPYHCYSHSDVIEQSLSHEMIGHYHVHLHIHLMILMMMMMLFRSSLPPTTMKSNHTHYVPHPLTSSGLGLHLEQHLINGTHQ